MFTFVQLQYDVEHPPCLASLNFKTGMIINFCPFKKITNSLCNFFLFMLINIIVIDFNSVMFLSADECDV